MLIFRVGAPTRRSEFLLLADKFWLGELLCSLREPRRRSVTLESQRGQASPRSGSAATTERPSLTERPLSWRRETPRERAVLSIGLSSRGARGSARGAARLGSARLGSARQLADTNLAS